MHLLPVASRSFLPAFIAALLVCLAGTIGLAPEVRAGGTIDAPTPWNNVTLTDKVTNNSTVTATGTTNIKVDGWNLLFGIRGEFENRGTLNNQSGTLLVNYAHDLFGVRYNAVLNNYGSLENRSHLTNRGWAGNQPSGTWSNRAGATMENEWIFNNNWGLFSNSGTLKNFASGTITHTGGFFINEAGASFSNFGRFVNDGGTLSNSGTLVFESGSVYAVTDKVGAYGKATLVNNGVLNVKQELKFGAADTGDIQLRTGSTLHGNANLTVESGHIQVNQGTLNNNVSMAIGGTLSNRSGGVLNNQAALLNAHVLENQAGAAINNHGTLVSVSTLNNAGTLVNNGTIAAMSSLNNSGTFRLEAGSTHDFSGAALSNTGTLELRRDFAFGQSSSGVVHLLEGGTVQNYAGLSTIVGHAQSNAGAIVNRSGGTFTNAGALNNTGALSNLAGGTLTNAAGGTIANHSTLTNGGTLSNAGTLTNAAGGGLANHGTWSNTGTLNNAAGGTFSNAGTLAVQSGGMLRNGGTLNNTGVVQLNAGSSYDFAGGTLNNQGTLELRRSFSLGEPAAGNLNLLAGGSVQTSAALSLAAGRTQSNAGTIALNSGGSLTIAGTLLNAGTIANNAGGRLVLRTSFENSGTIAFNGGANDFSGGALSNRGLLEVHSALTLGAPGLQTVQLQAGGTLQNRSSLAIAAGHTQVNAGSLINQSNEQAWSAATLTNVGTLVNQGTLYNRGYFDGGSGAVLNNTGTLINQGHFINTSVLNNSGTLEFAAGSTHDFSNGVLNNFGTLVLRRDFVAADSLYGAMSHLAGSQVVNHATLRTDGGFYSEGSLDNRGVINNTGAGYVVLYDYKPLDGMTQTLRNGGTFNNDTYMSVDNIEVYNSGQLRNRGRLDLFGSRFENSGEWINEGTFYSNGESLNSGMLSNAVGGLIEATTAFRQTSGAVRNDGLFQSRSFDIAGGMVAGIGVFDGADFYLGIDALLTPGQSIGSLSIDADLVSRGRYQFEIGGRGAGQFDLLTVHGSAFFEGGDFGFSFVDGYRAVAGDYWDFFSATSIRGWDSLNFDIAGLDADLTWRFEYTNGFERLWIVERSDPSTVPDAGSSGSLLLLAGAVLACCRRMRGRA